MAPIRILVIGLPQLEREIVAAVARRDPELQVVGDGDVHVVVTRPLPSWGLWAVRARWPTARVVVLGAGHIAAVSLDRLRAELSGSKLNPKDHSSRPLEGGKSR